MNTVSVIIPNYNRSGLVNETVGNVLAQSLKPHEVIVVDDGSTDDSVSSLSEEFGAQIQIISQKNAGPGAARNRGLEVASGKYIWFMDSDDLASLNKLETQVDALEKSGADIAYCPWIRAVFSDGVIDSTIVLQQKKLPGKQNALSWFINHWSNVFQQLVIRRESIGEFRFNEDLYCGEDGELFVRLLLAGCKVTFDNRSVLLYRLQSPNQLTGASSGTRRHRHWAKALLRIAEELMRHDMFYNVASSGFRNRIITARNELLNFPDNHENLLDRLDQLIEQCPKPLVPYEVKNLIDRIGGGVKQRLIGHRWHACFMAEKIKSSQIELLHQIGYDIQT